MANNSQIKWKKGDFISLGKAVSAFNKKINDLQNNENNLYLPDFKDYNNIKQNINTRKELNRQINSMKKFLKEGAEDLYITKAR